MSDQCKVGSIVDIANALQQAGQIMRGDVRREEPQTMTTEEIRTAKHSLESEINELLDRFQQEAGAGVWVAGIDLEHMEQIGRPSPIVADVEVDVRIR
jgi:hypothetical protein